MVVKAPGRLGAGQDGAPDAALTEELRRSLQRNQRSGFVGYSGKQPGKQLAAYSQIDDTSWFVVGTIPLSKLTTEAQSVRDKSVLIGLVGFLISIALAVILARSISAPLERLVHSMRETETGNYANRMTPEGKRRADRAGAPVQRDGQQGRPPARAAGGTRDGAHPRPGRGERQAGRAEP